MENRKTTHSPFCPEHSPNEMNKELRVVISQAGQRKWNGKQEQAVFSSPHSVQKTFNFL
jgi:hypothetical protein